MKSASPAPPQVLIQIVFTTKEIQWPSPRPNPLISVVSQYGDEPGGARDRVSVHPRQTDPLDAYALRSIAVSFRVTQVIDIVRAVHAMIPKSLFTGELRGQIAVV